MADFGGIAGEQLKSLIERIERLEDEKRALGMLPDAAASAQAAE